MPTLFISYKRGTTAVGPVKDYLEQLRYRLWFDRDKIFLSDNWKERIDKGLAQCDGVLLCLSPAACESENVQYEVKKAQELGKPIFPIILEKIEGWGAALTQVGLTPEANTEDFTNVEDWQKNLGRLRNSLEECGLRVSRHDIRRQRGTADHENHQRYLRRVVEQVGLLNLAQISPDNSQGVELERVYVDSPIDLTISVQMHDWQIVDWWLETQKDVETRELRQKEVGADPKRPLPEGYGFEEAPLVALLNQLDAQIAAYRQENPEAKPDSEYVWRNGEHNGVFPLHLKHIAPAHDRLVILGGPGSGKSTFVKYLALCLAGAGLDRWRRSANLALLPNWTHGPLTPVYVELGRFVRSAAFPDDTAAPVTTSHLWNYIQQELLGSELSAYASALQADLEEGQALLLLDGLDEVPYPENELKQRQQQLIGLVNSLNIQYGQSRIIVTSRPYAYEGWALPQFTSVTIAPFTDRHRIDLARCLYLVGGLDEASAAQKAEALNKALAKVDEGLKDRPLFVILTATLYRQGESDGLPTRAGALYRASILLLLDRWTGSKAHLPSLMDILGDRTVDALYRRLAKLAYKVHSRQGHQQGAAEIGEAILYEYLKPLGRGRLDKLIPYLSENAGVLLSLGQKQENEMFRFAHRTFQEYLAAEDLVQQCGAADSYARVREHMARDPQLWRQPGIFVADVVADSHKRAELWALLDDLLGSEAMPASEPMDEGQAWCVWLAATILQEQKMVEHHPRRLGEKGVAEALRNWSVRLIEAVPPVLPPVERAACGRALGLLGDPRPDVSCEVPEMVEIPAGPFLMGSDEEEDLLIFDALPQHTVTLPTYALGKYPVTNQQFGYFVAAGGYETEAYWPADGWQRRQENGWQQPSYWENGEFNVANQPVVGVSWYEAVAYCAWLKEKTGRLFRLPSEAMWEKGARGSDGRIYPWGDDYDVTKLNNVETDIGRPTAVGLFPDGRSAYELYDMAGNVSEWCSHAGKDYPFEPQADARRVLRGGAFLGNLRLSRSAYRLSSNPNSRYYISGFRLAEHLSDSDS